MQQFITVEKGRMKHTETKIEAIERLISEDKENGKSTFLLEGVLRKEKCSEEPSEDDSFKEDIKNIILDYEINSGKKICLLN